MLNNVKILKNTFQDFFYLKYWHYLCGIRNQKYLKIWKNY